MKALVLDTNVLVSGLLSPAGAPGRIIDLIRMNQLRLVLDDRIYLEYGNVLRRPKFSRFIQPLEREWILDFVFHSGQRIATQINFVDLPDPHDSCFLEVAATAKVPLVTGNLKHFPNRKRHAVAVLSPIEFLETLR